MCHKQVLCRSVKDMTVHSMPFVGTLVDSIPSVGILVDNTQSANILDELTNISEGGWYGLFSIIFTN